MILPREPCLGLALPTAGCARTALVRVGLSFCACPTDLLRAWCSRAIAEPKPLFKKLKETVPLPDPHWARESTSNLEAERKKALIL